MHNAPGMEHRVEPGSRAVEAVPSDGVWLRLIRGSSSQSLCLLGDGVAEETLLVGSSSACDWQVSGEGIAPFALELRVMADRLFARAAEHADADVDGEQLAAMWVPVDRGARLHAGALVLEVGLSGRSRAAQSQSLACSHGAEAALDESADSLLARFSVTGISAPTLDSARCDDTCAATVLDPDGGARERRRFRSAGVLIAGSLVACAYGCWVLLLDYF